MKKFTLVFILLLILSLLAFGCSKTTTQLDDYSSPTPTTYTLTVKNYCPNMPCNTISIWVDKELVFVFEKDEVCKYKIVHDLQQSKETQLEMRFYTPYLPSLIHIVNTIGVEEVCWYLTTDDIVKYPE